MKQILKNLYYLLLPLIYIGYLIYIRIILKRMPKDIAVFTSSIKIVFITFIIVCLLIRLYLLLKHDNLIKQKESNNRYVLKIKQIILKITEHLTEVRSMFIRIIANYNKNYRKIVLGWIQYYYLYTPSKKITILVFSFEMLPKIVVLVAFLTDIIFFKRLDYFYKSLVLLLLPVIPSFITAIIQDFYDTNIRGMIRLLDSKPIEGTEYHEFCFYNEDTVPDFIVNLNEFLVAHLCPVFYVPYINAWINDIRNDFYFNKLNILICILYILGWGYILLVGLALV